MSGIVGIVNLDGKPIDRQLLQQMTEFMAYRGPDDRHIWIDGNVGFGHALLRTTSESLREQQPCSLDGEVWITADARIDGRAELIEKLNSSIDIKTVTDVQLILRAYQVWEEDCVKHLLGDFAFAIWDSRVQRLFCARDHFGVKPFYYARVGNSLIFSNTLNGVRIHPQVSDELNDLAIADFLLFGYNQELDTTTFADIQRLPPAHCLTWSRETLKSKRYWMLPVDGEIRYKKASDYVENFKELMGKAVGDRLRTNRVAVSMSGGMDSTTIAATASQLYNKDAFDLRAFTVVYDKLIPDKERYYSGLVAEALNIPIRYLVADDYTLFGQTEQRQSGHPEPTNVCMLAIFADRLTQVAAHSRVLLDGNGGDPVFYSWGAYFYFAHLLKNWQLGRSIVDTVEYVVSHKRLPQPGLRSRVKRWLGIRPPLPAYPRWINSDFSAKLDLPGRWEQFYDEKPLIHPVRPEAYQQLTSSAWPYLFESCDPGVTGLPVEVRYPFFDLRLVNYLLAIPPVPWCLHKELMRVAMRGILPESVRRRPKSPLAGDPIGLLLQQAGSQWIDRFEATPMLAKYVDRKAMPIVSGRSQDTNEACINLQPLNLNYWLQNLQLFNYESLKEENHAF
ncbi:asparagine synthase-related protein [Argonema antarcticum]|uniref:asparagine synthase-related protein n=1 Tax=Argonema antarcticum TaxID=2942763 RepID=UPI0020118262|nr:asparagine synthase-related protein [Argonema antarcticum]MCL1472310.1 asparagine synthetase B [Argonema antarcticum A004/B2]